MAAAQPRPVGVVIGHGPQIIEHVCDAPRPADLIGFGVVGSTMDVSGPSQAGGTPHPDDLLKCTAAALPDHDLGCD
jgi:hypothetical protein